MASQVNSIRRLVAYFSMEIALENAMPSYSGGLGVLAGDTIRAAADLRLPMVAVSLLYRKGYFTQRLAEDRKSTRLNSSHVAISYAVFCLQKKKKNHTWHRKNQAKVHIRTYNYATNLI